MRNMVRLHGGEKKTPRANPSAYVESSNNARTSLIDRQDMVRTSERDIALSHTLIPSRPTTFTQSTAERFSSTLGLSCRGRLQKRCSAENQDGGSGLLQPLVRIGTGGHLSHSSERSSQIPER